MRVLAIRGKNLASLGDAFEVDLARPPLSDVGLFAITGPTGAGKSTILDALCLALFDQVPRLPGGHGVPVGRADEDDAQRIRTTDVRSLLRRGAGGGHAEVDFVGGDGRRYRARWEVWRARGRPEGRLQAQSLTLTDLDAGTAVGQTKTEVLEAIAQRIGLTFEQFRRSVLLAQGDFAAFLKADADERSSLLERITGTEIYSQLSVAAYQRATAESGALAQLRARVQDLVPLPAAEREAAELRRAGLETEQRTAGAERDGVGKVLAWHDRHDALATAERQARQSLGQAEAEWQGAEERRRRLNAVVQVQPLRPLLTAVTETAATVTAAIAQSELATTALTEKRATAAAVAERSREAGEQLEAARRRRAEQHDDILQARALDGRIGHATVQLEAAQARRIDADAALAQARTRVDGLTGRHEAARRRRETAEAWLAEHAAFAALAVQWPRWQDALEQYASRQGVRNAVASELPSREADVERLGREAAGRDAAVGELAARQAAGEEALQSLEGQQGRTDRDALRAERQGLDRRAATLRDAQSLIKEAAAASERIAEASRLGEQARAHEAEAAATLAGAQARLPRVEAALAEAGRAYALAMASASEGAEHLRATLRPGEPCPVCGSMDHPYAGVQAGLDRQVETWRERLAQLDAEKVALVARDADARSRQSSAGAALEQAEAARAAAEQSLGQLSERWAGLAFEGKPGGSLTDVAPADAPSQRLAAVVARQASLAAEEAAADALAGQVTRARGELDALRKAHGDARGALQDAREALARARADCDALREKQRTVVAELDRLAASLAPALEPLADWRVRLEQSPAVVREECGSWVDLWARRTREVAEGERAIVELERDLTEARTELRQAESAQQGHAGEQQLLCGQLEALSAERQGLLQGQPADVVEQQLEQAVLFAEQLTASLTQALLMAQSDLAGAEQRAEQAVREVAARQAALGQAELRLAAALERAGVSRPELESLLAHDEGWIAAEQTESRRMQDAIAHCRSVLGERQAQLHSHEADRPALDRTAAAESLAQSAAKLQQLTDAIAEVAAILKADDARRAQLAALSGDIERQEARAALWGSMNELIGSANGKKFRVYAQSLTLEALLAFANEHLRDLARRYRLQRVPRSDLELQVVDRDMGDEVRSVYSLSGGESFLVSLALALGLASLSSRSTQVESLFIDEGFGTLDQETLDVAIASLDTLQSLGRKVGVISHVPTLVERIGTQVRVSPRSGGRSVVEVLGA